MRKKSRKGKKRNVSNVVKEREYKKSLMGQISHCRSVLGAHKKGDYLGATIYAHKKGDYLRSNTGRVIRAHS